MFVPKFAFDLLKEAQEAHAKTGKFSDESLQALRDVFGNPFNEAVKLLETGTVVRYETPNSLRSLLEVSGEHEMYVLFPEINFCYCPVFKHQVLLEQSLITCKHVLAARLGESTVKPIPDSELVDIINMTLEYIRK